MAKRRTTVKTWAHGAKSVNHFCAYYDISRAHFYDLQREGKGPIAVKIGARTVIPVEAEQDWLAKLPRLS
jgi:predicted DNA-binding transcriptional regulator AlpA